MSIPEDTPTSGEKTFTLTELEADTGRATRDELHGNWADNADQDEDGDN